jgi:hypothetical protein
MYYFLLYNSNLINTNYPNQKIIIVLIYGSILYMVSHAIIYHTNITFLNILRSYFWNIFMLDIIVLVYKLFGTDSNISNDNLKLSINLLKNKIYNMMDTNNNINIEEPQSHYNQEFQPNIFTDIQPQINNINNNNNLSTPINKIKPVSINSIDSIQNCNENLNSNSNSNNNSNNFNRFPSSPLVYNPHIDIPKKNVLPEIPPPIATKKGFNTEYQTPNSVNENIKQLELENQNKTSSLKLGFSTTNENFDINKLLDENQSIASDVASMIDLDGFS